jgi:hypothetical protein
VRRFIGDLVRNGVALTKALLRGMVEDGRVDHNWQRISHHLDVDAGALRLRSEDLQRRRPAS